MESDALSTVSSLRNEVETFVAEREWAQFHSPKNLSIAIAIEAAELMELFLWSSSEESDRALADQATRLQVQEEIADVAIFLLGFCNRSGIDLSSAIRAKLKANAVKYPVNLARGTSAKYNSLRRNE